MQNPSDCINSIWKAIFAQPTSLSVAEFEQQYCFDLPLPIFVRSTSGNEQTAVAKAFCAGYASARARTRRRSIPEYSAGNSAATRSDPR